MKLLWGIYWLYAFAIACKAGFCLNRKLRSPLTDVNRLIENFKVDSNREQTNSRSPRSGRGPILRISASKPYPTATSAQWLLKMTVRIAIATAFAWIGTHRIPLSTVYVEIAWYAAWMIATWLMLCERPWYLTVVASDTTFFCLGDCNDSGQKARIRRTIPISVWKIWRTVRRPRQLEVFLNGKPPEEDVRIVVKQPRTQSDLEWEEDISALQQQFDAYNFAFALWLLVMRDAAIRPYEIIHPARGVSFRVGNTNGSPVLESIHVTQEDRLPYITFSQSGLAMTTGPESDGTLIINSANVTRLTGTQSPTSVDSNRPTVDDVINTDAVVTWTESEISFLGCGGRSTSIPRQTILNGNVFWKLLAGNIWSTGLAKVIQEEIENDCSRIANSKWDRLGTAQPFGAILPAHRSLLWMAAGILMEIGKLPEPVDDLPRDLLRCSRPN